MHIDSDLYPRLRHALLSLYPGCELGVIDQDVMPESVAGRWSDDELEQFRRESERALEELAALDGEAAIMWLGLFIGFPGADSASDWLRDLTLHLADFRASGARIASSSDGVNLPRVSAFHSKGVADAAVDAVNDLHAATIRAWADDPGGPWRLHLYADLGEEVGHHLRQDEVEAYQRAPESAPRPAKHPSTGCVVLYRKHPETREPHVACAYPEITLPTDTRDRFPDLPLLFGGYLGQDYAELDHGRWAAERTFNLSAPADLRARVARQLTELLASDDDTLRRDVEALGSYVLPTAMRRWVTGLHRRMTRIDWSRP